MGTHGGSGEIITGMDPNLYNAAFEGNMDAFMQVQDVELQLTPKKNTVLHVHFTAQTVSKEFVEFIISSCPSLVLQANSKGETPLHIAAWYGHLDAVEMLIETAKTLPADLESGIGPEKRLIRATNEKGDSALNEAVRYNHFHVVRHLTREDPDHSYSANKDRETPLYIAVERYYRDIVFEMLENCQSPGCRGPKGRTALHSAVLHSDKEMVKRLLEKEQLKSSIRKPDKQGCLPLHLAVQHRNTDLTKLLLEQDKETAYMRDKKGRTALHRAARNGDRDTMAVILSNCPDCAEIVDNYGQNALHYAVSHGYCGSSMANLILEKWSLSNLYNEKDAKGNTPLHLFFSPKDLPSEVPELIEHPRVDKLAFDERNRTAYDIAYDHPKIQDGLRNDIVDKLGAYGAGKIRGQRIQPPAKKKDDDSSSEYSESDSDDSEDDSRKVNKNDEDEDPLVKRARDEDCSRKANKNDEDEDPVLIATRTMRIVLEKRARDEDRSRKANKNDEDEDPVVKRARDSYLVVATLIATVTFAAGFTLPGGTFQDGEHQGTPILKYNPAFQTFIVTDTIAMVLSATAVFIHMFLALFRGKYAGREFLAVAFYMTIVAMASMMIAFVTGIFAMLGVSSGLGIVIILIGLSFFVSVFWFSRKAERNVGVQIRTRKWISPRIIPIPLPQNC